jgi:hypothetical protein
LIASGRNAQRIQSLLRSSEIIDAAYPRLADSPWA